MVILVLLSLICWFVCWTGFMFYKETLKIEFLIGSLFGMVGALISMISVITCH